MNTAVVDKQYGCDAVYGRFYTGDDIVWSRTGEYFYCHNVSEVVAVEVKTGKIVQRFQDGSEVNKAKKVGEDEVEGDLIKSFTLSPNNDLLCTGHISGLLRLWSTDTGKTIKLWKAQHKGPIVKVQFSSCGRLICSSGGDSSLRVWDYINNSCLCALKDFAGPSTIIRFHPNPETKELYAVGSDNVIYCWNIASKSLVKQMKGHMSQVTAISFQNSLADCEYMASSGLDKMLFIWKLTETDVKQYKAITVFQELQGVCFGNTLNEKGKDHPDDVYVACTNGQLKLVNIHSAKISNILDCTDYEAKRLLHCQQSQRLALVTMEHNILIFDKVTKEQVKCFKQLIGYNDEILDLALLGDDERYLAVATNSKHFKIYDTNEEMNCYIISGHNDIVVSLATNKEYLLTAGKDCSIFVWKLEESNGFALKCLAKNLNSHTAMIGSLAFAANTHLQFASTSQDRTMKVWQIQRNKTDRTYNFFVKYSVLAHDKEINSVVFSPNNKIIATASADKTAKLWSSNSQNILGTFKGHTRGVLCVRFSPVDQIVLTTSTDGTLRLWCLNKFVCLKKMEQENGIFNAEFIDHGKYIISATSIGFIKIWNIKNNTCIQTLDEHDGHVWKLAISNRTNKHFYSGGIDSKIIKWQDVTSMVRNEELDKRTTFLQQEQTLQNMLANDKLTGKSLELALSLDKPRTTFNIIRQLVQKRSYEFLKDIILDLDKDHKSTLMNHSKAWLTNSRFSAIASLVVHILLQDTFANPEEHHRFPRTMVEHMLPYVNRHFNRINETKRDLAYLEFVVDSM